MQIWCEMINSLAVPNNMALSYSSITLYNNIRYEKESQSLNPLIRRLALK